MERQQELGLVKVTDLQHAALFGFTLAEPRLWG
jgi:hypothetical protein